MAILLIRGIFPKKKAELVFFQIFFEKVSSALFEIDL